MPDSKQKIDSLAFRPRTTSDGRVGAILGNRYRLVAQIGAGASARVFLADDLSLGRRVAVKCLRSGLSDDARFIKRFRAEATAAAQLSHPNLLAVYDWDENSSSAYIVTEVLLGGSLLDLIEVAPLSRSQGLLVALQVAQGLKYAHAIGWVHRDIKPANLLFGHEGRLRIGDFGIARAVAEAAWTEPEGVLVGTARYAAPEQAEGDAIDGKADIYSLALTIAEAVTGRVPLLGENALSTMVLRQDRDVDGFEQLGALGAALAPAGRADPAARPTASELIESLTRTARSLPRPRRLPLGTGPSRFTHPTGEPAAAAADTAGSGALDRGVIDLTDRATAARANEEPEADVTGLATPGFSGLGLATTGRGPIAGGHQIQPGDHVKSRPIERPTPTDDLGVFGVPSRSVPPRTVPSPDPDDAGPTGRIGQTADITIIERPDRVGRSVEPDPDPVSGSPESDVVAGSAAAVESQAGSGSGSWLDNSKLDPPTTPPQIADDAQQDERADDAERDDGGASADPGEAPDDAITMQLLSAKREGHKPDAASEKAASTPRSVSATGPGPDDEGAAALSSDAIIDLTRPVPGSAPSTEPVPALDEAPAEDVDPDVVVGDEPDQAPSIFATNPRMRAIRATAPPGRETSVEVAPEVAANLRAEVGQLRARRRGRHVDPPRPVRVSRLFDDDNAAQPARSEGAPAVRMEGLGRHAVVGGDASPSEGGAAVNDGAQAVTGVSASVSTSRLGGETLASTTTTGRVDSVPAGARLEAKTTTSGKARAGSEPRAAKQRGTSSTSSQSRPQWLAMAVLICLILVTIGVVLAIAVGSEPDTETTSTASSVLAPATVAGDYVGRPQSEAAADARRNNWLLSATEERKAGTTAGEVIRQEPAAGEALTDGDRLNIVVSLGPEMATVPSVVGLSVDEATVILRRAEFEAGDVIEVEDEAESGAVLRMEVDGVEPDGSLEAGTEIDLVVSAGLSTTPMPSFVGLSVAQAIDQADELGLEIVEEQAFSERYEEGLVVDTEPPTDALVEPGDTVTIVVSRGAPYIAIPDVSGLLPDEAAAVLSQAGFTVGGTRGSFEQPVVATEPSIGEGHRKGRSIVLITRSEPTEAAPDNRPTSTVPASSESSSTESTQPTSTQPTSTQPTSTSTSPEPTSENPEP